MLQQLREHTACTCSSRYAGRSARAPVPVFRQRLCIVCRVDSGQAYPYNSGGTSSAGKATLENVFGRLQQEDVAPKTDSGWAGWDVGFQVSERNLVWNDDLKVRLIKRIAQEELGISSEEMEWRLSELAVLVPGLVPRLLRAPPKMVARAAAHTKQIGMRLLRLKTLFPQADCSLMVSNRLSLLLDDDLDQVAAAAARLRELLPGLAVDVFVALHPLVLDVECFETALEDCKRLMPGSDPVQLLRANPDLVLGLVKGKHLIPYDPAGPDP